MTAPATAPLAAHAAPGGSASRAPGAGEAPTARRGASVAEIAEGIRRRHRIADVAAGYGVDLRPCGRTLLGRCPLPRHTDRGRPNFYVYPETESWFCFRCDRGGDVIRLVEAVEEVGFIDACARLRAAPPAPASPPAPLALALREGEGVAARQRERAHERRWDRLTLDEQALMNEAMAVYRHALWHTPAGQPVLDYLRRRGLTDPVIRACRIGLADGHSLAAYVWRRGALPIAQHLGLLRPPGRGAPPGAGGAGGAEFLAGRVVVPELRGGNVVWMIGRALRAGGDGRGAKYLGLPGERPILGYERAAGRRAPLLCEGVFDYLTAVAWGLPACSPCGTHVPADRLGFLARAQTVYGVFDADEAGREASARLADLLGARWRPLALPDGTDLNDLGARPDGRAVFSRLLEGCLRAPP